MRQLIRQLIQDPGLPDELPYELPQRRTISMRQLIRQLIRQPRVLAVFKASFFLTAAVAALVTSVDGQTQTATPQPATSQTVTREPITRESGAAGTVNYVEGQAFINGLPLVEGGSNGARLSTNGVITTEK